MKFYVIYSPPLRENSGGILVLHTLGRKIQEKGYRVFMFSNKTYEDLNTISVTEFDKIKHRCIVIYPEIVIGNPLNAPNVVRLILNKVGNIGGDISTWSENDSVYLFWDWFNINKSMKIDGYLRVWNFKMDFFKDFGGDRLIDTHIIRKADRRQTVKNRVFNSHSNDSIRIDGNIADNHSLLRETLNKTKLFISYDLATYNSLIATLCGAISVVIPDGIHNKEEWVKGQPTFKYGVAYGLDDIEWAKKTQHKVREHLLTFEVESDKLVSKFIKETQIKFLQ